MSKISRWAKQASHSSKEIIRDVSCVLSGYRDFKKSGHTPESAYFSMRRLYRKTNGRFNDAIGGVCSVLHRKRSTQLSDSVFTHAGPREIHGIATQLRCDGFYQFRRRLPTDLCEKLLQFSLITPGIATTHEPLGAPTVFDRNNPQTVRHQFRANELFQEPAVQQVATDPYFLAIAQEYLGFNPVLDLLAMWWSAPGDISLQSKAAQLYHFDMDRFKFVKFFIYLTDVGSDNGPHCYVRGSHIRKPLNLLRDERISDEEIFDHYPAEDLVELTGPVGTLLAVDTRGFHKGKPLVTKDRLIFQIQFADSLFGQNYPRVHVSEDICQQTAARLESNRRCFVNFERRSR